MNALTLFSKVSFREDLLQYGLQRGDVAVIVETHPAHSGEKGYTLEVFNAIGDTIAIPTVRESQIEPLREDEILHVRTLHTSVVAEPAKQYKVNPKK